jgi:hypothetical protein
VVSIAGFEYGVRNTRHYFFRHSPLIRVHQTAAQGREDQVGQVGKAGDDEDEVVGDGMGLLR